MIVVLWTRAIAFSDCTVGALIAGNVFVPLLAASITHVFSKTCMCCGLQPKSESVLRTVYLSFGKNDYTFTESRGKFPFSY